jgi:hypothetical protein
MKKPLMLVEVSGENYARVSVSKDGDNKPTNPMFPTALGAWDLSKLTVLYAGPDEPPSKKAGRPAGRATT